MEQQEFAELAAIHFMDEVESHQKEKSDSGQSHDERDTMIMYKTSPLIINLYVRYNPENRWKPADDYVGVNYNGKDIRLIECGIIQTQFNAKFKRIRSFDYYRNEIDAQFDMPLENNTIDVMLKSARRSWAIATGEGTGESK